MGKSIVHKKKKHVESFFTYKPKKFKFYFKPNLSIKYNINYTNKPLTSSLALKYCGLTKYIDSKSLKSCIKVIKYYFRVYKLSKYNFKINLFPSIVLTAKPKEVRMGKGKGPVSAEKVGILKYGQIILKILNVHKKDIVIIRKVLLICSSKIPYKNNIIRQFW